MNFIQILKPTLKSIILFILLTFTLPNSAEIIVDKDCENCFTTELVDISIDELCITYNLKIYGLNCTHSLSHFTAEVLCGTVTDAENSGGWKMEYAVLDPKTQLNGLKVDDITSFSEDGKPESFTLTYTVCASDSNCLELLKYSSFRVGYKAGTCVFIDTVDVYQDSELTATLISVPIDCYGESTGEINVTVNGGVPPYNFVWNTGENNEDLISIPAGDYSVLITDNEGSKIELNAIINQNPEIITTSDIQSTDCGIQNGFIRLTTTGGISPYNYKWSNDSVNKSISNLSSGVYTVEITDFIGCSNIFTYFVPEETTLTASLSSLMLECHEDGQGEIIANVYGGNGDYSYLWSNGDTTQTITNLFAGSYSLTVTDSFGCSIQKTAYVAIKKLYILSSVTNPICDNDTTGRVEITIRNGSEPYDIKWSTGDTTTVVKNLIPEWYWVTVTDVNGCTYKKNINVPESNSVEIDASFSLQTCDPSDSTIVVTLDGNGGLYPYTFFMDGKQIKSQFIVNVTGIYSIYMIDANGCNVTKDINVYRPENNLSINSIVTQPTCDYPENGGATININGGATPYTVTWSDGISGEIRSDLLPGVYIVNVTDDIGCESNDSIIIQGVDIPTVQIIDTENEMICNSTGNLILADLVNVSSSQWEFMEDYPNWGIESTELDRVTVTFGQGVASIILNGYSEQGCLSSDTLDLMCSTDSIDYGDIPGGCEVSCFDVISFNAWEIDNGCVKYQLTLGTNGNCNHALSHVVIGLDDSKVIDVSNTKGWKMELNMHDPTTGLYGFKIDDIQNFGDNGSDQFIVTFTICDNHQEKFQISYKAGQCIFVDNVIVDIKEKPLVSVYNIFPNPFTEQVTIQIQVDEPINVKLSVYDIYGNEIKELFDGELKSGITEFYFSGENSNEHVFFYKIISKNGVHQGKLIKIY